MSDGDFLILVGIALLGAIAVGLRIWAWAALMFALVFICSVNILAHIVAGAP